MNLKRRGLEALVIVILLVPQSVFAVSSADEICAPTDDPCVINSSVVVDSGAVLDFGLREVSIVAGGQLDIGIGDVTVRCGDFTAAGGTTPAILARGASPGGTVDGGFISIEARRACSDAPERYCLSNRACDLGTCSTSVCSGMPTRNCAGDAQCQLGTCNELNRCSLAANVPCSSDLDCNLGTCSATACSQGLGAVCASDGDCQFGSCTGDTGDVFITRNIRAEGNEPGTVLIHGAGDVSLDGVITADATNIESDGGGIDITSGLGTIRIDSTIKATGGGRSQGGEICISAGVDVITTAPIDMDGGDFDGGFIEIDAGRDVLIGANLEASSNNGEGFGGEIALLADRDIVFTNSATHRTNGNMSFENFAGDGGAQDYSASGSITVPQSVSFESNGAQPDGFGDTLSFTSTGALAMAGDLKAKGLGAFGGGGAVELISDGLLTVTSTSKIDTNGGSGGGGDIDIFGSDSVSIAGQLESTGGSGGIGGTVLIDASDRLDVSGSVLVNGTAIGTSNGSIDLDACELSINSTATVDNRGDFGLNFLSGGDLFIVSGGAKVLAEPTGENLFTYRSPGDLPTLIGTVTPSPTFIGTVNAGGCLVCGDSEVDPGETCDDGNTVNGDGCSSSCQDEDCIADTPNWPNVPLCDDGDPCTTDMCTGVGCSHTTICTTTTSTGATTTTMIVTTTTSMNTGTTMPGTTTTTIPMAACGNGTVEPPETCDDGSAGWTVGEYCDDNCVEVGCGDTDDNEAVTASDALFTLRVAVSLAVCDGCICDVDGTGSITAGDALRLLRNAVGLATELTCPVCPS